MAMRKNFEQDLTLLKSKITQMGELSQQAFKNAIEALKTQDTVLAQKVIDGDVQINELETEVEELIVKIIAAQQPVATDLRKIMSALKITTSVERIGDFAVDIAKAVKRIGTDELAKPLQDLPAMAEMVDYMIGEGLNAYVTLDSELAKEIAEIDDKIDTLYSIVVQDLFRTVQSKPDKTDQVIQLAFISRYIERIADHVTNIAEGILYEVKGKRVDLNQ